MRARPLALPLCVVLSVAALACKPGAGEEVVATPGGAGGSDGASAGATTPAFENPGGMWMPAQLAAQADTLKKAGFALDPAVLTDPTTFPLGAVVSLGGCSASFVSPDGLIITNHHCVTRYLQENSTPEKNLLKDGFLAGTRADEKSGGPLARVYVTRSFADVTAQVLGGLEGVADPGERYKQIGDRRKSLVNACEAGKPEVRCQVASFYEGARFFQIEQLEIRDVRLVYAPHAGIGVFGGEVDNWRWPRHTGDYSFLRAYVGGDGKPADFAATNVPYKPPHFLKVATDKVEAGDFVMVAGYPGRTSRLKTAGEAGEAAEWYYPRQIKMYEEYIAVLEAAGKDRPDVAIKAASRLRGLNNYLTNFKGMLDGLVKGKLAEERVRIEGELQAWIEGDAGRKAKYGDVLAQIQAINDAGIKTRERDMAHDEVVRAAQLLKAAETILKMADERKKPDAQRSAGYQERDLADQEKAMIALDKTYDPGLDRAVMRLFLMRAASLPAAERPESLAVILGKGEPTPESIDKALDRLFKGTKLGSADERVKLLKKATPQQLKASKDTFIRLALDLRPISDAIGKERDARQGAMAALRPRYIEALMAFSGKDVAPDANSTLRVTYGSVRGYRPRPGAPLYRPFTVVSEMVAKATGTEPFAAPQAILDAAKARKFGPYADPTLGEVPVNFLADLDITGGNSGSATLNARGELVGVVFDGNYESMASDWIFLPEITRSIHCDIRYILWVMDAVDGADHLLQEMGVTPTIQ